MDIANSIDWDSIEAVLMGHYQIGTSKEGADAYPPLLLFKCLFLKNGSESLQILNLKAKSIIESPLKSS